MRLEVDFHTMWYLSLQSIGKDIYGYKMSLRKDQKKMCTKNITSGGICSANILCWHFSCIMVPQSDTCRRASPGCALMCKRNRLGMTLSKDRLMQSKWNVEMHTNENIIFINPQMAVYIIHIKSLNVGFYCGKFQKVQGGKSYFL